MQTNKLPYVIGVMILLLLASMCVFRLNENQQAIVTVFGKPREQALNEPGLKFKLPWWQVLYFDKRILRWDGDPSNQLNTVEQTFIKLDTTARWRITDPLKFYTSVKNVKQAQLRLDDIIDSVVRTLVSQNDLIELVRNDNREPEVSVEGADSKWEEIKIGRESIMQKIISMAKPILQEDMGIELIDVRIKRLNYVNSVEANIFDRMITERKRIAQRYRSEGEGEAANIVGSMERKLKEIESEAYKNALEIEGQADAEAVKIYADAYNLDPEFYSFLKTLESYKSTLGKSTKFITTTDSDYFEHLKKVQ